MLLLNYKVALIIRLTQNSEKDFCRKYAIMQRARKHEIQINTFYFG